METIYKMQPNRGISLRGFSGNGAAAAITQATNDSFIVSGVFRDAADFAVVVIWDRDDFWGHPQHKYLPDPDFTGQVLTFDVLYTDLEPIDSPKNPTIDWPYLDVSFVDGTVQKVNIYANATLQSGTHSKASGTITITTPGAIAYDRVTLWYQNVAFDYIASGGETASAIAANLASQINSAYYGGIFTLSASVSANVITITASPAGYDGNMIRMYSIAKNSNLTATPFLQLSGGSSNVTWSISLNFNTLFGSKVNQVRQMWFTYAPQLTDSTVYTSQNFTATYTNWTLTPGSALKVAGPGSVRLEETDSWVNLIGTWSSTNIGGFFSKAFCALSNTIGDSVQVQYNCQYTHNLYLGTALYVDRGQISVTLDGIAQSNVDMYLDDNLGVPVLTRVLLAVGVSAGLHQVTLKLLSTTSGSNNYLYFDFIEAAVLSDVPSPTQTTNYSAPAVDYDTQHGYQIPPARLLWMLRNLGFYGPIDHYLGVFWWNQRSVSNEVIPYVTVTISASWNTGDQIFMDIGGSGGTVGKTVFPADTQDTICNHFVYFINETFPGVWASYSGSGVITITCRSAASAFQFTFSVSASSSSGGAAGGTISFTGSLTGGSLGTWYIDPSQTPVLNKAASDWQLDFYNICKTNGQNVTTALSMELVNPPDNPGSGQVWASRYYDNTPVLTATGFGGLNSSQCAPCASNFLSYQKACYLCIASLQNAAGLNVDLQFGEFLWWYFAKANLVPVGFASYTSPISIGTNTAHGLTTGDKVSISGVLGNIAANGTWTVTVTDTTHFTLNGSSGNGNYTSGGYVTGGGMAYYDAETKAAALSSLGRNLINFWYPFDDPSQNSYADSNFLLNRLASHVNSLISYVKGTYNSANFEVLYPYDVNHPTVYGQYQLGGPMNYYVNTPASWLGAGVLTRIKLEALDFGSGTRSLDLVQELMNLASSWSWGIANIRYLFPIFNGGCPFSYEQMTAKDNGILYLTPFAMDHVCQFNWDLYKVLSKGASHD